MSQGPSALLSMGECSSATPEFWEGGSWFSSATVMGTMTDVLPTRPHWPLLSLYLVPVRLIGWWQRSAPVWVADSQVQSTLSKGRYFTLENLQRRQRAGLEHFEGRILKVAPEVCSSRLIG